MSNSLQAQLAKIRTDAAECLLLSTLATDKKSEMFVKMAEHLNGLALEIEKTIAANGTSANADALHQVVDRREANHREGFINVATPDHDSNARSPRVFLWLSAFAVGLAVAGSFIWMNERHRQYLSSEARQPALEDFAKQAIAALQVSEQTERKALSEKLNTVTARLDHLENELDYLKSVPAQIVTPSNKTAGAEETSTITETKSSSPKEKRSPGDPTAAAGTPTAAKRADGEIGNVPSEPAARVGTIAVPGATDVDGHKLGPVGCEHFRSFDVASGTYVALDGRRRPCR